MTNILTTLLESRDWILADGATGTNLIDMGLTQGYPPEFWNVEEPDKVRAHYRSFIDAGSDIVLTNTFGGTAPRLKLHKSEDRVFEINRAAAALLRDEIDKSGRQVVCAGSVGPSGEVFQPLGELSYEDGRAAFSEQMRGLKAGGVDVVWIETMFAEDEMTATLEAAKEHNLPAVCTMSFDTSGRTMMGLTPADLANFAHRPDIQLAAFGGNCGTGAPDLLVGLISMQEARNDDDIIVAKANCGIPEWLGDKIRYNGTPELMADYAVMARDAGARIIGGCCGTTPVHVRAMKEALETRPGGAMPTMEQVIEVIGPLTGTTSSLVEGGGARRTKRRRRRREE